MFSILTAADERLLWVVLAVLLLLVVIVGRKASASDVKLKSNAGYKRPMFALEMNAGKAPDMFESWDEATKATLRRAISWDYIFLFIYPAAIATTCFITSRFLERREIGLSRYGLIIICLQLVAAMFDAAENFAMLRVLDGAAGGLWPQTARWCAITKFGIAALGVAYVIVGILFWLAGWFKTPADR